MSISIRDQEIEHVQITPCWVLIRTFLFNVFQSQYTFVYRAISDYVDLYRNKDDEYAYSVPINSVNSNGGTLIK